MSNTQANLRYFLASRGQTAAQIAQTESDLMTLVNAGTVASWDEAAQALMHVLSMDDWVRSLESVQKAAGFTSAMQQLVTSPGHSHTT